MGNKQEELEICVQFQDHSLTAITETWWDSLHDWSAITDGFTLFRKGRPTRRDGGVAQMSDTHMVVERLIWVTLLWVFTRGHLFRQRK